MKRWILALVMLGLSVVPALAETAVTTGMGYKKMLSELCALYKQESGKQLTEVYSGTIGQSLAQYKAGSITRQDFQDRYMEIRSGLEETSRILKLTSDHVIERDAEYQKTLAQAQAKGQVSQRQQAPRKEKKAWNNSRRELESTRQDVDMRLATYEQTVNNLML